MEHRRLHDALVIEIFAGTGGITAWIRKAGMNSSFGVDSVKQRHPKAPIIILDLLTPEGERLLWQYLQNDRVIGVWLAPPCGTCSKAREIQNGGPQPLRSDFWPDGFMNLLAGDLDRVSKANALYSLTADIMIYCFQHGLFFFVENPFTSIFWKTSAFQRAASQIPTLFFQAHAACAYGSKRPKRTLLASNVQEVELICHGCPGNHVHLKWGQIRIGNRRVFATAEEKHYPAGLCALVSKIVLQICHSHKLILPMDSLSTMNSDLQSLLQLSRAQTNQFSRSKLPQLLSEYKEVIRLTQNDPRINEGSHLQHDFETTTITNNKVVLPKCARLLSKLPDNKGGKDESGNFIWHQCTWGIQWSDFEFIDAATKAGHPRSFIKSLPTELQKTIEDLTNDSDQEVVCRRAEWARYWLQRRLQLEKLEKELHNTMDEAAQRVAKDKKILLFEEMLRHAGYSDMNVVSIVRDGVPLVGQVQQSGHFAKTYKPAAISVEYLEQHAADLRGAILSGVCSSGDKECDSFVYDETLKELERGWLSGPHELSKLPHNAVISRRFALWQKTKYRCIDDYSGSLVNATCTIDETPFLHTIDIASALLSSWMQSSQRAGTPLDIVGRSYDLKAAYRQLFIEKNNRPFSYISIHNPHKDKADIFGGIALPFGSVQSVYSFLRVAHSLWFLGTTQLTLPWTFFYDDFLCFSKVSLAGNTHHAATLLFKLLGWNIAEEGSKAADFAHCLHCLGVTFDLSGTLEQVVKVSNTTSRVEELTRDINSVIKTGSLKKTLANRLRGRMQFAENQIFGRLSRRALKAMAEHSAVGDERLSFEVKCLLSDFVESLNSNRPRLIDAAATTTWFIFTDAFYEKDAKVCVGLGGVLINSCVEIVEYFSEPAEADLCVLMGHGEKGTIIFEAELLAVWIAMKAWKHMLAGSMIVFYVDNDSVRGAYAASTTRCGFVGKLIENLNIFEEEFHINIWVARVPTRCNIADPPSRFDCSIFERLSAKRIFPKITIESLKRSGGGAG